MGDVLKIGKGVSKKEGGERGRVVIKGKLDSKKESGALNKMISRPKLAHKIKVMKHWMKIN